MPLVLAALCLDCNVMGVTALWDGKQLQLQQPLSCTAVHPNLCRHVARLKL